MQILVKPEEAAAIRRALLSGSPTKIILTWRKSPALRVLADVAAQTERKQTERKPTEHAKPTPTRTVAGILAQLAKRNEVK